MLKNLTPRIYQQTILATCATKNTLVVLPTGLGKTALAIMMSVVRLNKHPESKILLLAPTKPLCEQHQRSFQTHLDIKDEKIVLFTGSVDGTMRAFSSTDGALLWSYSSNRTFETINGIEASGGSLGGPGPTVVDGMV